MTRLEWIEFTGSQWFDTQVLANTTDLIFDMQFQAASGHTAETPLFLGSWAANGYFLMIYNDRWRFHSGGGVVDDGLADTAGFTHVITTPRSLSINGTAFPVAGTTNVNNAVVFGYGNSPGDKYLWGKLKSLSIYMDDVRLREYTPVLDDNERPALYDAVSARYIYSAGASDFVAGPVVRDSYTVSYNANGGSGSMANQTIEINVATPLSPCTFIAPDELSFAGWALSAAGEPVYGDGQTVTNLASVGETVTNLASVGETVQLFAVWRAVPGFEIKVQYNASEVNRLDKEITDIMVLRGILRAESSIIDPVFMVQGSLELLAGANYLTIPIWGRKYFIRDIVSIRTNLVQISAHVDVLSSWPDELRACKGIVHRQERDWNLYLNDGVFRVYQNPDVFTQPFPSGFNTMAFVLAVAGGTGSSMAAAPTEITREEARADEEHERE